MGSSHQYVCQPPLKCPPAWSSLSSAAWLHYHLVQLSIDQCACCIRGHSKFLLLHIILQKLNIAPSKGKADLPSFCTNQLLLHTWRRGYRMDDASFFLCWDTQLWGPPLTDQIGAQEKNDPRARAGGVSSPQTTLVFSSHGHCLFSVSDGPAP